MKIAIVNDLRIATEALRAIVVAGGHQVVWTAVDGLEGVEKARMNPPDLILMDLVMPRMDGAEATRNIRNNLPIPILVVTASVAANFDLATKAMGYGAMDVVLLPTIKGNPGQDGLSLLNRLKNVEFLFHPKEQAPSAVFQFPVPAISFQKPKDRSPQLVVIGSSTGGPAALEKIVSGLGTSNPAAFIFLQHIGSEFAETFGQWLNKPGGLEVSIAKPGDFPIPGKILLSNSHQHLVMGSGGRLEYSEEPKKNPFLPSIDVFMISCAQKWAGKGIAGVLTGIGRDGAKGLLALRNAGWTTFAQDEGSSVVLGMPKAAAELGAAKNILALGDIAYFILRQLSSR